MKLSHLPARVTAGVLILNAGLDIRKLPDEAAAGMQDMGANGVPPVKRLSAGRFRELLSRSEVGLGAALLTPFVPSWVAGAGLAGFSGALMAKDTVMFGTGITLVLDDLLSKK